MGELLDRGFQRSLLEFLAQQYPGNKNFEDERGKGPTDNRLIVNLTYLEAHGLVEVVRRSHDKWAPIRFASITAKGLDFIADDGGLSAILGGVTIKLHEDTIKRILIDKIAASPEDDTVKNKTIAAVKELPAEAVKNLVTRALEAGLAGMPTLALTVYGWITG